MNDSSSDSEDSYIPVGLSKINLGKFANIKPQTCNVLVKSVSTDSFNLIPELLYEYLLNRAEEFLIGDKVDIVGTLEINSFNGRDSIQFNLKDIMKSL